jgi:predicted nuclease of predicted toxin-antitoxin system
MLRLLANENVPGDAVEELRRRGHDVFWARTDLPGASDEQVLATALAQQRLLVTFDKDFGELVYHRGRDASCGIVLFRIRTASPNHAVRWMLTVLESRTDWSGCFWVVQENRLRKVALPARRQ